MFKRGEQGSGGGGFGTLLWENPNPTTAFPAQTVSLDLTDYTGILVIQNVTASSPERFVGTVAKGGTLSLYSRNYGGSYSTRKYTPSDTGVVITSTSDGTRYCIPQQIYGVKLDFQFQNGHIASVGTSASYSK